MIKVGSDFSGVGAFDQALIRLCIDYETIFACDMDKYARKTFIHNYGEPKYYPENVYDREIPTEPLDIYMTSPPCQAFSLAGNRKGEDDKRGVLFYNSHEFIQNNKPRYFIFENVKGLISDDGGKTFARWIDLLGGKSVNGNPVIFPHENSTPYHVYHKVLNAKNFGVPQNRERVFIIGIRDDVDNKFSFPKEFTLVKRIKDVLEENVYEKYFLSEKMIEGFISRQKKHSENGNGFCFKPTSGNGIAKTITNAALNRTDDNYIQLGFINQDTQASKVYSENRVGQALTTSCNQGIIQINNSKESGGKQPYQQNRIYSIEGISTTLCRDKSDLNIKINDFNIRKLTPRECFRLMDFPDSFDFSVVSDSQAYKQAGNSIVVNVLCEIIKKLNL